MVIVGGVDCVGVASQLYEKRVLELNSKFDVIIVGEIVNLNL